MSGTHRGDLLSHCMYIYPVTAFTSKIIVIEIVVQVVQYKKKQMLMHLEDEYQLLNVV